MNIAMILSNSFPPEEGIGFYTYNLSKKLIEKGHEVTIITRGTLKTQIEHFEGIKVIKAPFLPLYPFHVQFHGYFVNKIINNLNEDFDLIHIHSPLSPVFETDIPIIGTIHTSLIEDIKHFQVFNLKSIGIKLTTYTSGRSLTQKLINKSKFTTTVSSSVANELIKYYNAENPMVIGNGVNEDIFFPIKDKSDDYLLYVGRLDYRKGILDLINAACLLDGDMKILIVGKGPLEIKIQKLIKKNNIKNIKLIGHISGENLVKLYQNASMFVFPSHYEGLPTVVLEAMSCGLPIILSDIPAHKDITDNNENGIFCNCGSAEDIAEKINILSKNKKLRIKLGKNARKTIEEKFTWDIISLNYEKIYKNLIEIKIDNDLY